MSDFTIDWVEIDTPCPKCGFFNPIWIRQARLRDVIICRGCKANVQLDDHMNEVRNAERSTRRAVQDLMKSLSKTLTIKI